MIRVKASGLSDVGLARTHNEDCFEIDQDLQVYVVADGMGGHSHGEVASRIAVTAMHDFIAQTTEDDMTWPVPYDTKLRRYANRLKAAVRVAHDKVLRAIRHDASLVGMGTTVVSLIVEGPRGSIAHVGDSRAYRCRGGKLELLTQDHTWVNEQVVAGYLSEDQARTHPLKNVVTRALGGESEVLVDIQEVDLKPGDLYLLCSDGLTTMLSDTDIEDHIKKSALPEELCRGLVKDANGRGGLDNITVIVLAVEDDPDADEDEEDVQLPKL
ncbi:MAG: Stp1/IreP family PP2C-type Ser/Thr phosphatase [Acidobacteriota bacterium]